MILSNETLNVLRNFASINQGLEFKAGNKLATISPGRSVLAQATLNDVFPQDFCIYDMNEFLSVHSLFKTSVELDFDAANVTFTGERSKIQFRVAEKKTIVVPPEKTLKLREIDCAFSMSSVIYDELMKTAKVLSSPHIAVRSDGETIQLVAFDANNDGKHNNSIEVGSGNGKKYTIVFKTENFKMIQSGYDFEICFDGIAHFKNNKDDIAYWVATETKESKV